MRNPTTAPLVLALVLATAVSACARTESDTDPKPVSGESAAATGPGARGAGSVEDRLREMYADFGTDTHFFSASVDLNGDGINEVIAHVVGPMVCGTGGCNTLVFTPAEGGYELVGEITVTRPPIRVSSHSSNGWRNLIVHLSGGGIEPIHGEVLFDGRTYQSNPTAPMVEPAMDLDAAEIVIPEFETFTDGTPLSPE